MKFEAEIISEEILPAIRKIIADRLHRDYGYTQEEIAAKLEVTQPAVSQYLQGLRANMDVVEALKEDPQINVLLDEAVSRAAKNKDYADDISRAVQTSRDKGLFREKFKDADRI